MKELHNCFILIRNHQDCTSTASDPGREPGKNDFEMNVLDIMSMNRVSPTTNTYELAKLCTLHPKSLPCLDYLQTSHLSVGGLLRALAARAMQISDG